MITLTHRIFVCLRSFYFYYSYTLATCHFRETIFG